MNPMNKIDVALALDSMNSIDIALALDWFDSGLAPRSFPYIYRETSEEPQLSQILYYRVRVPRIELIRLTLHWHWIGLSQDWLLGRFPIYRETSEEPHLSQILYYRDRVP